MRKALRELLGQGEYPDHAGLAYDVYAPLDSTQKLDPDPDTRNGWFKHFERKIPTPEGYEQTLERWVQSVEGPHTFKAGYRTLGRLLVGHGNAAPSEVGITLHRTWGVPIIPGSSIKGLLAHYIAAAYGPEGGEREEERLARAPFKGIGWKGKRIIEVPGAFYAWLFGSPEIDDGQGEAKQGSLVMHDALWLPGKDTKRLPLKRDILTVHQKEYYRSFPAQAYPNDYDNPNPVSFLSVREGARFMFTWSFTEPAPYEHPEEVFKRVERYLDEALGQWGIGGKTSSGYGRMEPCSCELPKVKRVVPASIRAFETWLEEQTKAGGVSQQELVGKIDSEWGDRLKPMVRGREREEVLKTLRKHIKKGNARDAWEALIQKWSA